MIDLATSYKLDTLGYPIVEGFVARQLESAASVQGATHFVRVEPSGYLEHGSYYAMR